MTRERKARKIPPYNDLNDKMREQMAQFDRNRGVRDITLTSTSTSTPTLELERQPARAGDVPRPRRYGATHRPPLRDYRPSAASSSGSGTLFWVIIAAVAGFIGHDYIARKRPPASAPRLQAVSTSDLRQLTPAKTH
jgi:hypothetical protein